MGFSQATWPWHINKVYLSILSNWLSIINAAFWLVELLLGYMLKQTSYEKRRFENQNNGGWIAVLSRYFLPTRYILLILSTLSFHLRSFLTVTTNILADFTFSKALPLASLKRNSVQVTFPSKVYSEFLALKWVQFESIFVRPTNI